MQEILLFILLGLGSGALIAGIALAVVLTYRGSGVINLSTGAVAMLGGYAFWALTSGKIASLPTAAALPLALLFVVACGALVEFAVFRPLRNSSPLSKMVSSLGVLLIAESSMLLAFGTTPQYWMNLQAIYDLKRARDEMPPEALRIAPCSVA